MTLKVRLATLNDISAIMVFSRRACESSPTWAPLGFNSIIWRNTLKAAFSDPTMPVFITVINGEVFGILVGMKMPMPWCAGFSASDLVFVAEKGGDKLLAAFTEWCIAKKVRRIDMGVSDTGRDDAKDKLFAREGFSKAGHAYYRINEVM